MVIGDTLERNRRFYPDRMAITHGKTRIIHKEFTWPVAFGGGRWQLLQNGEEI